MVVTTEALPIESVDTFDKSAEVQRWKRCERDSGWQLRIKSRDVGALAIEGISDQVLNTLDPPEHSKTAPKTVCTSACAWETSACLSSKRPKRGSNFLVRTSIPFLGSRMDFFLGDQMRWR